MADLPRILAKPDLPTVNLPRVSAAAAGAPFEALSHAAGEWQKVLAEKEKGTPVDAALKSSELNIRAEGWKNEVQATQNPDGTLAPSDPATWGPSFRAKYKQGIEELLADEKDPRISKYVRLHAALAEDAHVKELNNKAVETVHGQTVKKVEAAAELSAQYQASTQNQVLKDLDKKNIDALIKTATSPTMIGGQIYGPAWTKGEELKVRDKYDENVEKYTAYFKLDNKPAELVEELKNPNNYTRLSGPEREQIRSHANDRINKEKQLTKEAKKDAEDEIESDYLDRNMRGTLTPGQILTDKRLPAPRREHWRDVLHRQEKEAAKANKEDNPFEKSDGATRAMVMQGVFTNPKAWPPDRIMSYTGKGLSNAHTHQLVEDQITLSKDKTGNALKKYDPLNRAMTTLDGLRRNYMFTKEGQIGAQKNTFSPDVPKPSDANASAALRMKNDEEYGKVADRIRQAAENGQDPQAVLQQEMKPYFADKTKTFFDNMMNFFSEPRNAEVLKTDKDFKGLEKKVESSAQQYRQNLENAPGAQNPTYAPTKGPQVLATPDDAARQFLMDNNLLITPATIEKTKAYLKSKGATK